MVETNKCSICHLINTVGSIFLMFQCFDVLSVCSALFSIGESLITDESPNMQQKKNAIKKSATEATTKHTASTRNDNT